MQTEGGWRALSPDSVHWPHFWHESQAAPVVGVPSGPGEQAQGGTLLSSQQRRQGGLFGHPLSPPAIWSQCPHTVILAEKAHLTQVN